MPLICLVAVLLGALVSPPDVAYAEGGTVIVRYRPGQAAVARSPEARRIGVGATIGSVRGQGARVAAVRGEPRVVAARLQRLPGVLYAEANARLRVTGAPDDPLFADQLDLAAIHVTSRWASLWGDRFPSGGGTPVGVVDTGVDSNHEDLAGHISACASSVQGRIADGCADDNGHGTHTAGTIAAAADNGVGIAGIAFNSPLVVCRALGGAGGSGTLADVASCIRWAHERGARVISMSLGGNASITLANAVRAAWAGGGRRGAVLVAAAGNDAGAAREYPAGYEEVVSVAATDDAGGHAAFSNANDDVEIAAPGVDVLSTKAGGGYERLTGTSMAVPHVSGAAALLFAERPRAHAATIRRRLVGSVRDAGAVGRDALFGFGMLDLASADEQQR